MLTEYTYVTGVSMNIVYHNGFFIRGITAVNVVVPTLEEKYNYNFGFHDYKVTNFMSQNI